MKHLLRLRLLFLVPALAGCQGLQSAVDPHGPAARELTDLTWLMVGTATVIWLLVLVWLAAALRRAPTSEADIERERGPLARVVTGAVAATALIVAGLTVVSFLTTKAVSRVAADPLVITVRGQQWWWQFVYQGAGGKFETANEMHIPVGRDVVLHLESPDVIHSFWVPSLAGKQDLVPGRHNVLTIRADRPGVYRGQCAEFCGLQHSHMSLFVIAEAPADYDKWATRQRLPADEPQDPSLVAGRTVFLQKQCAACHTIRGTSAQGKTAPDLTHVGGRHRIAAGLLENTRGAMAAWIADPQTIKPGNNMPLVTLSSDELRQVSAYLESLQ